MQFRTLSKANNKCKEIKCRDAAAGAVVLITSVLPLFFAFGNFNSFVQVFIYTPYDKKRRTRKVRIFESALPFKQLKEL
jgi:hypothetical protein